MTISVSVERYISVIYPLLSIRLHSRHSYLYLALPSLIFSIIFTLPTYFVVETKCSDQNSGLKQTEMGINISQVTAPFRELKKNCKRIDFCQYWILTISFKFSDEWELFFFVNWFRFSRMAQCLTTLIGTLCLSPPRRYRYGYIIKLFTYFKLKFCRFHHLNPDWSGQHGGRVRHSWR